MATFNEMIKNKAVESTFLKKQAVVAELKTQLQKIKSLDTEVPNARSFHRVEVAANNSVEALKEASRELNKLLYKGNPDVEEDEDDFGQVELIMHRSGDEDEDAEPENCAAPLTCKEKVWNEFSGFQKFWAFFNKDIF